MRIWRSLPSSHLTPVNPDWQAQLPSLQVPSFKQEKASGQTKPKK